jgi:hypothetical protein
MRASLSTYGSLEDLKSLPGIAMHMAALAAVAKECAPPLVPIGVWR